MAKNKINPTVSITLLLLFVMAAMYMYFDQKITSMEAAYQKSLKEEVKEKQVAIDSLTMVVDSAKAKIALLETKKKEVVEDLKPVKDKIKEYEKPRYYADATFDTESKRIANSRYRYSQQDSTTGPRQSYRDWKDHSERRGFVPREQIAKGGHRKIGESSSNSRRTT